MKTTLKSLGTAILAMLAFQVYSQEDHSEKPSCCTLVSPSLPPVGIMGDHHHHKGGWMVSYRYRNITMDGLQNGTTETSQSQVLQNYMMAPVSMKMQGHMIGVMYGVGRSVTAMIMLPYMTMDMDMTNRMGMNSTMSSQGIGDIKISAIAQIWSKKNTSLLGNLGLSLPTGSIDERNDMAMGENILLPYAMQIGSGSTSLLSTITLSHSINKWTIGTQLNSQVRLNDNHKNYRFGDALDINLWTAYKPNQWISASISSKFSKVGQVSGVASELNMMMSPLANINNSGNATIVGNIGINIYPQIRSLENHAIGLDFGVPLYQETTGTQMSLEKAFTLGWQYSF